MAKVELHLHLGGSWPLEYLASIANEEDITVLNSFLDLLEGHDPATDYHAGFQAFGLVYKIINDNSKVEGGAAALCRNLAAEGVTYVEIRTGLKDLGGTSLEAYLVAVLAGIRSGCSGTNLVAKVLLSLKRNSSHELAHETLRLLKKYRSDGVVGLDISDDAMLGDCSSIVGIMDEIHAEKFPVALHLGECAEETEAQQWAEIEMFKPKRLGHGVFLFPSVVEWVKSNSIPIEMCLTSAVRARMISSMELHPGLDLLRAGHPVAVCSDDPLIFRTTISNECALAAQILGFSEQEMQELQSKSLSYAFSS